MTSPIETAIFELLGDPEGPRSISPEAIARRVDGEGWRRVLPQVRPVALGLARQGRLSLLRHGKPVEPHTLKGVYRLGPPDAQG